MADDLTSNLLAALVVTHGPLPRAAQHQVVRTARDQKTARITATLLRRDDLDPTLLETLAANSSPLVRAAALARPELPADLATQAAASEKNQKVLVALASSTNATEVVLDQLADRSSAMSTVALAVIAAPRASDRALVRAISDLQGELATAEWSTTVVAPRIAATPQIHDALARATTSPILGIWLASSDRLSAEAQSHLVTVFATADHFSKRAGATALGECPVLEAAPAGEALTSLQHPYPLPEAVRYTLEMAARRTPGEIARLRALFDLSRSRPTAADLDRLTAQLHRVPTSAALALARIIITDPHLSDTALPRTLPFADPSSLVPALDGRPAPLIARCVTLHPELAGPVLRRCADRATIDAVLATLSRDRDTEVAIARSAGAAGNRLVLGALHWSSLHPLITSTEPRVSATITDILIEAFGESARAWETFFSLAGEFEGTLDELTSVCGVL